MSALPKQLLYQNKVDAMGARPYTSNIQPQGSQTYTTNDVIILNVPCNRNTVLSPHDTYLKFSMVATNSAGGAQTYVRLAKAGAHSFFQRLRLYHGSTLLEDLDGYNNLLATLCTKQRSSDNINFKGSVMEGFDESTAVLCQAAGAAANGAPVYSLNALRGQRIFNPTYSTNTLANGASTPVQTYCIPLVSILGSLGDKYLPLFAMTSAPLRLELQLVPNALIPFVSTTAMASFSISNVELIGSFIELSDQALSVIQQSQMGAPLTMAVNRWSNIVSNATLNNSPTTVSVPVPFKYSSVQCLLNTIRQHSSGAITYDAFASYNFNINEYYFNFGSEALPSKHPGSSTSGGGDHITMFAYLCSALGSPYDLDYNPCVSLRVYDTLTVPVASGEDGPDADGALSSIQGSFAIGQELVSFPSANQDQMYSGRNTSTEEIYHVMLFNANATTPSVRFDYYCLHHAVIICENGGASIRF